MAEIMIAALVYFVIGLVVDIFVHLTHRIIYWDGAHRLWSHAILIATWPYVVFSLIFRR